MSASADDLDQVLARHDAGVTSHDLALEFDAALSAIPAPGATALTQEEADFLTIHGGDTAARTVKDWDAHRARSRHAQVVKENVEFAVISTLSIAQAAALLGVDRTRISHRIADGSLYAFTFGRQRRIPRWQFTAHRTLLPGLRQIIAAIPAGMPPRSLDGFLQTAQPDFGDQPPVAYLAAGGDPAVVAEFLTELDRW